jgi:spore coat polysaccharide biosynthesis predicted glycosyltransferase SpsG
LSEWIHLLLPDRSYVPQKILFRVDAGKIWGLSFGHLFRCITLASVFQKLYNSATVFLMRNYTEGIQYARNSGQHVKIIPDDLNFRKERELIIKSVKQFRPDVVVVDLPYQDVDMSYFPYLRSKGIWILFIDESRFINPDADVILNSSIRAVNNTKQVENIRYLLGPEHFIYEGAQRTNFIGKKYDTLTVVITFGGSDPSGLTLKVLAALAKKRWNNVGFKVIFGPGNVDVERAKVYVQENTNTIQMFHNPPDIYPFFLDCDLAVCAGGRTLYELHTLHIPAFAIASIEHEAPEIRAFLQHNMLIAGLEYWNEEEFLRQLDQTINFLRNCKVC